tara:strand:+ start:931 stop:2568 length:1638 start_codon:yes stop_codon:yes gene_type:complete
MKFLAIICLFLISFASIAVTPDKLGNVNAPKDGTYNYRLGSFPPTINPFSYTDVYAAEVHSYTLESLCDRNIETYEWQPRLAKSWDEAKDGKSITFTLRDGIKWHDGKPFTAEDIKFTFDAIMDKDNTYKTARLKPYYENIGSVEILAPNKVKFNIKTVYFGNFSTAAGMSIVPKHIYSDTSKKNLKKLNKSIVGTGPYVLKKYKRGKKIELVRNSSWWGKDESMFKPLYNFKKIRMKVSKDDNLTLTLLEKEKLDFIGLTAEQFFKKTGGKKWGKEVFKKKYSNKSPKSYGFIGMNLKNQLFKNVNVRKALYHLVNRPLMIEKFLYGMSVPATGPWYRQSIYADPSVKPVGFDPKKALELLRKEGWKDSDGDMILDKKIDGKKVNFSFTLLEPNKDFEKYLTIFKEDAKKAGIDVRIKIVEWNTFIKLLDERNFEAVRLGWGGGAIDNDPKQIWHSDSIAGSGSNFVSYSNKNVDKLIDQARKTLNRDERIKVLRKVYKQIASDVPYLFLFNAEYNFYGHTKRMKGPKDTFTFGIGTDYWWVSK